MNKDIQNQLRAGEIFSSLKNNPVQCNGYTRYQESCRTAPVKSSAVLWPYYIACERWKKEYICRHNPVRNLVLQLILEGNMRITDDQKEITVGPGMIAVVPPGNNLMTPGSAGFCETVSLVFNGTALDAILNSTEISSLEIINPVPDSYFLAMRRLIDLRMDSVSNPADITAESCRLILETSELIKTESDLPESLSLALHYMRSGISENMTMDMLVRNAHCTRQELQKLFRQHFGETPFEHFGKMRLEPAAEYLRNSRLSIKEIALQCGFKSQLYFSTAFRKNFGMPPRVFRETAPEEEDTTAAR